MPPEDITPINPFDAEHAPGVSLTVLMRIYDALMALLEATDQDMHDRLDAIHESGGLAWSLPFLNLKGDTPDTESEESVPPSLEGVSNTGHLTEEQEQYRLGD